MSESSPNQRISQRRIGFNGVSNPLRLTILSTILFVSCCINVMFMEMIIKRAPESGNIITLASFIFISTEGFLLTHQCGFRKPVIPIREYITLVILFFLVSFTSNYALNFKISMPLHMIIKSGSLIANMIMGIIILKKTYPITKYLSVGMITFGILMCTFASAKNLNETPKAKSTSMKTTESDSKLFTWLTGVFLLLFSLFTSAYMGIFQERLFSKYGKHPKEALYYTNLLPLPFFLLFSSNIYDQILLFNKSPAFGPPVDLPILWVYLLVNTLSQYICIRSVFVMTSEYTSLTVTMILTLRKFFSLVFSVFYFQNQFTSTHWFGTMLIFIGTFIFIDVWKSKEKPKEKLKENRKPKE